MSGPVIGRVSETTLRKQIQAERDAALARATQAEARVKTLEKALLPFADIYNMYERNGYLSGVDFLLRRDGKHLGHAGFTIKHFAQARAALQPTAETSEEGK